MGDEKIKLTREELYQKVWSKPATSLAKDLGITTAAIAKICKDLNVPRPYSGYWQQVAVGRGVQPPLSEIQQDIPKDVVIHPNQAKPALSPQSPEVPANRDSERQAARHISVAQTLRNAHPLVSQTKQLLEKMAPNSHGIVGHRMRHKCLDVRVSRTTLNRALRIFDALLKALEATGHSAVILNQGCDSTFLAIQGQKIKLILIEKTSRSETEISEAEKRNSYYATENRQIFTPTSKLTFIIDEYWPENCRKKWSDTKQKPIEDQLDEIIIGVIAAVEALRQREIKRLEEETKRIEAEFRRMKEARCRKILETQSDTWSKIQNIRLYLHSCEELILNRSGSIAADSVEAKWLAWAHRYADGLDPLKNGDLEAMVHEFETNLLDNRASSTPPSSDPHTVRSVATDFLDSILHPQ
jgi:hypothetical protein